MKFDRVTIDSHNDGYRVIAYRRVDSNDPKPIIDETVDGVRIHGLDASVEQALEIEGGRKIKVRATRTVEGERIMDVQRIERGVKIDAD